MKKQNPSKDQLSKSIERRIKHLMIRVLEKFEDIFPDDDETREGQIFKGDLRNIFNDAIRAQRDELNDYSIEYRPLRIDNDNTLAITQTFIQTVQLIEFGFTINEIPYLKIFSSLEHARELEAIRSELGTGVLYELEDKLILEITGVQSCIDSVLPCLDKYRFHASVKPKYKEWRQKIVNKYTE